MGTTTTRLGLYKPLTDGSELVNVSQDIDAAYDKIDLAVGYQSCTSSTRPSTPYSGKPIQESDTARTYFSNGSVPASGSWVEIPNATGVYQGRLVTLFPGSTGSNALIRLGQTGAAAANRAIAVRGSGDTVDHWEVDFDGAMQWGPGGSTTVDTNLYRGGVSLLKTDDALTVALAGTFQSTLAVTGATTLSSTLGVTGATTLSGGLTVVGIGQVLTAYKGSDESVTSSTTLQDDDALTINAAANATYLLTGYIKYSQNLAIGATAGIKAGFALPASGTLEWTSHGTATLTSAVDYDTVVTTSTGTRSMAANGAGVMAFAPSGSLVTTTAGILVLRWAQVSSSATATIVKAGSWIRLERVA